MCDISPFSRYITKIVTMKWIFLSTVDRNGRGTTYSGLRILGFCMREGRGPFRSRFLAAQPPDSPPRRGKGWVAESDSMPVSETHPNPSQEGNSGSRSGSDNKKPTPERGRGPGLKPMRSFLAAEFKSSNSFPLIGCFPFNPLNLF